MSSPNTVFFGGAGVSTESGIPDFRGSHGIFKDSFFAGREVPAESILHIEFFMAHPEQYFEFHRKRLVFLDAKPNKAHLKLAELEKIGKLTAVITQNIDGLHTQAGSENVIEMHGSIHKNVCMDCGKKYGLSVITESTGVPRCGCGGIIRPMVTLYGEELDANAIKSAVRHINEAQMLVIAGTSLQVYPVAGLLGYFRGKHLVVINKTTTHIDNQADLVIRDPVGEVMSSVECEGWSVE